MKETQSLRGSIVLAQEALVHKLEFAHYKWLVYDKLRKIAL